MRRKTSAVDSATGTYNPTFRSHQNGHGRHSHRCKKCNRDSAKHAAMCLVRGKKSYVGTAIDFHNGEHAREMEAIRQRTKRARYFFRGCQIPLHPAAINAPSMNKGSRPQMFFT